MKKIAQWMNKVFQSVTSSKATCFSLGTKNTGRIDECLWEDFADIIIAFLIWDSMLLMPLFLMIVFSLYVYGKTF